MVKLDTIDKLDDAKPNTNKSEAESSATNSVDKVHSATRAAKEALIGRDTVYVDSDDDATSIVSKLVASDCAVVALVPSVKCAALNSIVSLKLIMRAAQKEQKKITLITTDPMLIKLAARLSLPVAKSVNAQSVVPVDVSKDSADMDDFIDGRSLPVADHARLDDRPVYIKEDRELSSAVASIEADDRAHNDADADGINDDLEKSDPKHRHGRVKVPNFKAFRNRVVLGVLAAAIIISLGIWGIVIAPHAKITIQAKTIPKDLSFNLMLVPNAKLDLDHTTISPVIKTVKLTETVQFDATGSREQGNKARGNIKVSYKKPLCKSLFGCKDINTVTLKPGQVIRHKDGKQYTINDTVTLYGIGDEKKPSVATVGVTATTYGPEYNSVSDGDDFLISGYDKGTLTAQASGSFSGGTRETVKVVSKDDVDRALSDVKNKLSGDNAKEKLASQLNGSTIIQGSFNEAIAPPKVSPAVDQVSRDGKGSVTVEATYTMMAVDKSELAKILEHHIPVQAGQRIYDSGMAKLEFKNFQQHRKGYVVTLNTVGYIGPVIDESDIKRRSVGKKRGEIKQDLAAIPGVQDVKVDMSPFWVGSVNSDKKIEVSFKINQ